MLRLSPAWTHWAFWLLLAVVGFYAALGFVGRVSEYATGPAVVRVDGGRVRVFAVLPGSLRPLLATGVGVRLELQGFPYQYQELTLDELGEGLVGAQDVRQEMGASVASTLVALGPLVRVRAQVANRFFDADGQKLAYFDGMQGTVTVRVKSERIATALVPGLKRFLP